MNIKKTVLSIVFQCHYFVRGGELRTWAKQPHGPGINELPFLDYGLKTPPHTPSALARNRLSHYFSLGLAIRFYSVLPMLPYSPSYAAI